MVVVGWKGEEYYFFSISIIKTSEDSISTVTVYLLPTAISFFLYSKQMSKIQQQQNSNNFLYKGIKTTLTESSVMATYNSYIL